MLKISKKMIRNMVIFSVALLLIAGALIYPNYKGLNALEKEAVELRKQIEEQKLLKPVFAQMVKRSKTAIESPLPFPKRQALTNNEIREVIGQLRQRAADMGLEVTDLVPGVRGFVENASRIEVTLNLQGDINDFKTYLLQLSADPFTDAIASIQVRAKSEQSQFRLVLWIARKT